ncbi:hypothetical protein PMIN06_002838 [Paraphaeosphaeria minitans]|uniref:Uncharacterized protein n=1 Tax=Paraphaeosphaeria minitans TaxID=565426 RepID=A0A9P6GBP4_9PLEO|nr:hypothetical protein PMIN01_09569 [Paraphaeosphaeria minitans]
MLPQNIVLAFCAAIAGTSGLPTSVQATNPCPADTEMACLDVINSSLCLSQNASRNGTAAQMAACVDYPGGMSDLSGASKLCRCPGCHSKYINEAISKLFPPPCS